MWTSPGSSRCGRLGAAACLWCACAGSGVGLDRDGRPFRPDAETAEDGAPDAGAPYADGGNPADERGRFGWIQENIFTQRCAVECHRGASAPKGLQLDAANAYRLLVEVPSVEVPVLMRVEPGSAQDSYLYIKVIPSDPRRTGERMPRDGPPYLTDEKIEAIRTWIARGAPRD